MSEEQTEWSPFEGMDPVRRDAVVEALEDACPLSTGDLELLEGGVAARLAAHAGHRQRPGLTPAEGERS